MLKHTPRLSARWQRVAAVLAALALAWTLGLGWWLPRWLKPQIEHAASAALNTPVTLADLSISPWTLTARLNGLHIGPAQAPLLTLAQAEAQVSLQTLWRAAPVIRRLTITQPQFFVERLEADRFNLSPVLDHLYAQPAKATNSADAPARFAVYNIRLIDGNIRYRDHVLGTPTAPLQHTLSALQIGLPFLSNLPSHVEINVEPLLQATLNGSPLRLSGRSQPFDADHASELALDLRAVDLAFWAQTVRPLLPPEWRVDVAEGQLNAQLTLAFEQRPAPAVSALRIGGQLNVAGLAAQWPQQGLAWRWRDLALQGINLQPLVQQAELQTVALHGVQLTAVPPAAQAKSSTKAAVATAPAVPPPSAAANPPASAAPSSPPPTSSPWAWRIGTIDLSADRIDITPPRLAQAASTSGARTSTPVTATAPALPTLGPLQLTLRGLDSSSKAPAAQLAFSVTDRHKGSVQIKGSVQPHAHSATLDVQVDQLQPGPWLAPWAQQLPLRIKAGALTAQARLEASPQALTLSRGELQWAGLQAQAATPGPAGAAADHLNAAQLTVAQLQAQLTLGAEGPRLAQVQAARFHADRLDLSATRDAAGRWLWLPREASAPGKASNTGSPAATRPAAPPVITLGELRCTACAVSVTDLGTAPVGQYAVTRAELRVGPLSTDLSQRSTFALSAVAQRSGTLNISGELRPEPLTLRSKVRLIDIDMRAFQSAIEPHLQLTLSAAKLQVDGQLTLNAEGASDLAATYRGRLALTDVRAQDRITDDDFVRWKSASLDGLDVAWRQGALTADLGQIALRDFDARLILNPDGRLNLSQVLRKKGEAERSITTPTTAAEQASAAAASSAPEVSAASGAPATATASAAAAATTSTTPPALRWRGIALSGGRVDFSDTFIKPNYAARLTQLNGSVSAVSSSQPEPAEIKLTGKVDDAAPLTLTGFIHPLGPRLNTDLTLAATGIELTRLSPYAARYAGYPIERGTLSATVHYQVSQGQLQASNKILLDQLTFGSKVESPDATKLPVLLAVSLLKNTRGEIDINLPIAGSLDDPQFSVGGIIVQVLVNLLNKAITAPFALLTGNQHDAELGFVAFDAGSDQLNAPTIARLNTIGKALTERPALKLEITGHADPATDTAGLQQQHLMRLMRNAKARATEADPQDVSVAESERERWLLAAYQAANIKKPRNAVGLPKALPAAEMAQLLAASAPLHSNALIQLANRRSDAVKAHLTGKLEAHRVLMGAPQVGVPSPDGKAPAARVQFALR